MSRYRKERETVEKEDSFIEVKGIVLDALPKLEYNVEIDFQGLKHTLVCHVSGKMKTRYIQLRQGDEVMVRISVKYDITRGIIFKRLTERHFVAPV